MWFLHFCLFNCGFVFLFCFSRVDEWAEGEASRQEPNRFVKKNEKQSLECSCPAPSCIYFSSSQKDRRMFASPRPHPQIPHNSTPASLCPSRPLIPQGLDPTFQIIGAKCICVSLYVFISSPPHICAIFLCEKNWSQLYGGLHTLTAKILHASTYLAHSWHLQDRVWCLDAGMPR